jgi:hypothetical protein
MQIDDQSKRTTREVFERFSREPDSYDYDKTVLALRLEAADSGSLVSRSQAKRLLARMDRFSVVVLDFEGVGEIGPAFADEVFRVFAAEHPEVQLISANEGPEVQKMIERAKRGAPHK